MRYARATYASGPLIAWGSSYSAGLVLRLAGTTPGLMDDVMAFSPGEYFPIRSVSYAKDAAVGITIPTFITSSSLEHDGWQAIFGAIPTPHKTGFIPVEGFGQHGSSTLVSSRPEREAYWRAVETFLTTYFPSEGLGSSLRRCAAQLQ